jgi:hypothetical protein
VRRIPYTARALHALYALKGGTMRHSFLRTWPSKAQPLISLCYANNPLLDATRRARVVRAVNIDYEMERLAEDVIEYSSSTADALESSHCVAVRGGWLSRVDPSRLQRRRMTATITTTTFARHPQIRTFRRTFRRFFVCSHQSCPQICSVAPTTYVDAQLLQI